MNLDKIVFKIRNSELDENDVLKYGRILITEFAKEHHTEQLKLCEVGISVKEKHTLTFGEWKKKNVEIDRYGGYFYKDKWFDAETLALEYKKNVENQP